VFSNSARPDRASRLTERVRDTSNRRYVLARWARLAISRRDLPRASTSRA